MKLRKISLILMLLPIIIGCSSKISMQSIDSNPMNYRSYMNAAASISSEGFYFNDGVNSKLFYNDLANKATILLTFLSYVDDKPYDSTSAESGNGKVEKYSEIFQGETIFLYDEYIYFVTDRTDVEGKSGVFISRVDKQGKNKENVYKLDTYPASFFIHRGYLYVYTIDVSSNNQQTVLQEIDLSKDKVIREVSLAEAAIGFVVNGDHIYYYSDTGTEFNIWEMDISDLSTKIVANGNLLSTNGDYMSYYILDKYTNEEGFDNKTVTLTSSLYNLKTKEVLATVKNEIIDYIDVENNCYYTSQIRGIQNYKKYDLNTQKIISEIKPSASLDITDFTIDGGFFGQLDVSQIIRVNHDTLISQILDDSMNKVKCSFQTQKCEILDDVA